MKSVGVKIVFLFLLLCSWLVVGQTPYDVVKKNYKPEKKLVHDFGQILNPVEKSQLERKLVAYNDSTSVQVVIVTFQKLDGYPIHLLGSEIGENWGVGQKNEDNGVVIVLSKDDRKVDIRTGYGSQVQMPPTISKLIIDQEMIPEFRNGNYYQGLDNAITAIQQTLAGKYKAKPKNSQNEEGGFLFFLAFVFIVILFIIIASKGGGGNRGRRRYDWGDVIISSSGSSPWLGGSWSSGGGSWGGGSSGGGFGGFGGGSFGGGGATGSW